MRFEKKVFYYLVQEAWNKVAVVAYAYEASKRYFDFRSEGFTDQPC